MTFLPALALAAALGTSPHVIATLDLEASGVPPDLASTLGLLLPNEVRAAFPSAKVISGQEIRNLLGFERQKQLFGCTSDAQSSCLAEIGSALGAEELVGGNIGRVGRTYVLVLRRLDTARGQTIASLSETVSVDKEEALVEVFRTLVRRLFTGAGMTPFGLTQARDVQGEPISPWKYGVLGAGGLLLIGGAVAGAVTASDYGAEDAKLKAQAIPQAGWSADLNRIQTEGRVADALLAAGVVAGGIGAWLVFHKENIAVTPVAGRSFGGGSIAGVF